MVIDYHNFLPRNYFFFHDFVDDQKYNCVISSTIQQNTIYFSISLAKILLSFSDQPTTIKSNRIQFPNPMTVNDLTSSPQI